MVLDVFCFVLFSVQVEHFVINRFLLDHCDGYAGHVSENTL